MATESRRTRGEGSIYQRADGRWFGVVDLGWVGGKRLRKSVSAATLRELRPKFRALKELAEQGVVPTDATVEQWVTYWLAEVAPKQVRPRTLLGYQSYARTWIVPQLGKRKLSALRPEHIRAMHRAMEDAGRSSTTRRQAHLILQAALKTAVNDRRLSFNPAQVTKKPAADRKHHGVLTRDEALAVLDLLAAYGADGLWGITSRYLAALLAGLRQGEALGLRWEDVTLTPGRETLLITRTVQRQTGKGLVVTPTKSGETRLVPALAPLAEALRRHRDTAPDGYVWGGDKPTEPRRDYQTWQGLLWAADVPKRPLHAARATTASILGEARVPLRTIADILGHSEITTSWSAYITTDDRQMRAALDQGWAVLNQIDS